jgi:hypothetical protein
MDVGKHLRGMDIEQVVITLWGPVAGERKNRSRGITMACTNRRIHMGAEKIKEAW